MLLACSIGATEATSFVAQTKNLKQHKISVTKNQK